jgi:hypothetical protein
VREVRIYFFKYISKGRGAGVVAVQSSNLTFSREGLKYSKKKNYYFSKNIKKSGFLRTGGDRGARPSCES